MAKGHLSWRPRAHLERCRVDAAPLARSIALVTVARILIFVLALGCGATTQPERPAAPRADVELFLRQTMRRLEIPGMQVAIAHHGRVVFRAAWGLADLERKSAVTSSTRFPYASITKAFTGVAVIQLVEQGKLQLDAAIGTYLPDLPETWRSVTIRELLTHVSGLPDVTSDSGEPPTGEDGEIWARVQTAPLLAARGAVFRYTQTNYILLGRLIASLRGSAFERVVVDMELRVAAVRDIGFAQEPDAARGDAVSYLDQGDGPKPRTERYPTILFPAAGLMGSADELLRWSEAVTHDKLFRSPTSRGLLWTPGHASSGGVMSISDILDGYASGWLVASHSAHRAVGAIGGGRSALVHYPDDDLTIVVLTNKVGAEPERFADELAGFFLSHRP